MKLFSSVIVMALMFFTTQFQALAAEHSAPVMHGNLVLKDIWARETPPNAPVGAGYMIIQNQGSEADRLVAAETDIAGRVEIHEMAVIDGVMKMRELEKGLAIPAGESVTLKPGGYHLMFMQLKQQVKEGQTLSVTLEFEHAGRITLPFMVRKMDGSMKMKMKMAH